jgi:hypothetical protein
MTRQPPSREQIAHHVRNTGLVGWDGALKIADAVLAMPHADETPPYKMFQENIFIRDPQNQVNEWFMFTVTSPSGAHVAFFSNKKECEGFVNWRNAK